ncbi:MAG: co-chaperone DjlA [Aestuariibacter sp.]|jgi:DnaJ like chaperone protein|uniref:co-chaperone DjlA n=2 Tax=Marisediminitalea TaxID=2662254 RepID=UPI000C4D5C50|nr:co-chaperone DjlA [Marisediminitalea aggregata]MBL54390.1 co-chaperone DjlA [Alteromonadaceae bacterium]MCP3862333.1 co-chaperone DjlA [Aestuariibacter sp.]MCP4236247.1 co-chaperone DjlA [Aestuariibacter sp.]MCP4525906.1 co-chaperone DjlA [Aestuariibacter sp.]MCP4947869.1 co-chaperone DjlA [Aestuariibacter sp.]
MPSWGTVLGFIFGFLAFRIPGAILGAVVGYLFDKGYAQDFNQSGGFGRFFTSQDAMKQQAIFFHSLFASLGHLAKADGQVTEHEILVATRLMDDMKLHGDARKEAQQAFREGKERDFPISDILKQLHESCHGRRDILQVFLEILIQAAFADGHLSRDEYQVLEKVAKPLGFVRRDLDYLIAIYEAEIRFRRQSRSQGQGQGQRRQAQSNSGPTLEDAYTILGVSASDDEKTIKRAYRKRMSEHHPDKLASKGLPEQAMEIAKSKAQDIQAAYELVKSRRGFK